MKRRGKETLVRKPQHSAECIRPQMQGSDWRGLSELYILIAVNQFFVLEENELVSQKHDANSSIAAFRERLIFSSTKCLF